MPVNKMAYYDRAHAGNETNFVPGVEVSEALAIYVNTRKISFDGIITEGYVMVSLFSDFLLTVHYFGIFFLICMEIDALQNEKTPQIIQQIQGV